METSFFCVCFAFAVKSTSRPLRSFKFAESPFCPKFLPIYPKPPLLSPINFSPLSFSLLISNPKSLSTSPTSDYRHFSWLSFPTTMRSLTLFAFPILSILLMAFSYLGQAQDLASSPAPPPSSDGTAIDQGIAYSLMLIALAITYLFH